MPIYDRKNKMRILKYHLFDLLGRRNVEQITIQKSKFFSGLQGKEIDAMTEHVWSKGDKLISLSNTYYGTSNFWWVIAIVNSKPTDAHYSPGDIVYIPRDPEAVVGDIDGI